MCCNRCIVFVLCQMVMHYVWSRWPAWSGSSCDRLQCTVPGSTSPTLSGISPAAIIAYFSGTCKSRRRFPPPFSATFRLSLPQPYRPFCRWLMPRISVGGFRQPSSQRRFCCWLPLLFPSADPSRLRRRPILHPCVALSCVQKAQQIWQRNTRPRLAACQRKGVPRNDLARFSTHKALRRHQHAEILRRIAHHL